MKEIKVLFVSHCGDLDAGSNLSMIALIKELERLGVKGYAAIPKGSTGAQMYEENDIPHIVMNHSRNNWTVPNGSSLVVRLKGIIRIILGRHLYYKEIAKYIKTNGIDIVHENNSASFIGYYAAKKTRTKHIWHIREFLEEDFSCNFVLKKYSLNCIRQSDAIICVSKAISEKYNKIIPSKQNVCVYNGIKEQNFYYPNRKDLLSTEETKIICVGKIDESKGQETILRAISLLTKEQKNTISLTFAGGYEEEYYNMLKRIAKEESLNVDFLGKTSKVNELLRINDIFIMSSICEAFGRTTVEAMLAGCLVIGSNTGGTREILDDGNYGLMFKTQSPESLRDQINRALANKKEMRQLAEIGQEHAVKTFTANNNALEIYKVYSKLLSE